MSTTTDRPTVAANRAAIQELREQLEGMRAELAEVRQARTATPTEVADLKTNIEILENRLGEQAAILSRLGDSAADKVALSRVETKITGLTTSVDAQRHELNNVLARAEAAHALAATANRNANQALESAEEGHHRLENTTATAGGTLTWATNLVAVIVGAVVGLLAWPALSAWFGPWDTAETSTQVIWAGAFVLAGAVAGWALAAPQLDLWVRMHVPERAQAQTEGGDEPADGAPADQPEPPADPPTQVMPANGDEGTPNA